MAMADIRAYYGGYYGYPYYHNGAWIAVGAGILGVMLGSVLVPRPVYVYPIHRRAAGAGDPAMPGRFNHSCRKLLPGAATSRPRARAERGEQG
jgi:hypothetical protein